MAKTNAHIKNEVIREFKVGQRSIQLCRKLIRLQISHSKENAHPRRLLDEMVDGGRQLIVADSNTLLQHLINLVDGVLNSCCGLVLHNGSAVGLHAQSLLGLAGLELRLGGTHGATRSNGI